MKAFEKSLEKLAKETGVDEAKTLWKYSVRFANTLIARTQPKGSAATPRTGANKAKAKGEQAVARDVARAYPSASTIYLAVKKAKGVGMAAAFWKTWKDRDPAEMKKVLNGCGAILAAMPIATNFDGGLTHRTGRDARGRYTKRRGSFIFDREAVKQYSKKVVDRVLWAKAGWVSHFNPPGGKSTISAEVRRHTAAPGKVTDRTRAPGAKSIDFTNSVFYVSKIFRVGDALSALRSTLKAAERDLKKLIEKRAKKELEK